MNPMMTLGGTLMVLESPLWAQAIANASLPRFRGSGEFSEAVHAFLAHRREGELEGAIRLLERYPGEPASARAASLLLESETGGLGREQARWPEVAREAFDLRGPFAYYDLARWAIESARAERAGAPIRARLGSAILSFVRSTCFTAGPLGGALVATILLRKLSEEDLAVLPIERERELLDLISAIKWVRDELRPRGASVMGDSPWLRGLPVARLELRFSVEIRRKLGGPASEAREPAR